MSVRTDLALERLELASDNLPTGTKKSQRLEGDIKITTIEILSSEASDIVGKPIGKYSTIEVTDFKTAPIDFEKQVTIISNEFSSYLPKITSTALIVGLGNNDITPDALGPRVISYTLATRHVLNGVSSSNGLNSLQSVSAIAPGVLGQTGIETSQIIRSICNEIKPSCVIVIDALASKSISRLGKTIQISNTGISPGSGVQNSRSELSKKTLGVPVICVGVPTVVDMATIAKDILGVGETENGENMMVTPREIDLVIEHAAKTVAFSVNLALQPSLTLQDLVALAC